MRLLIRSDNRHEKQLTILEADRSFVRFMETHSHGIVSMHTQASTAWHQKYEEGTVKTSLRAMLWGVLLMEWQARLIEKDTQVLQLAETAGWATRPEWNPEQKKGTAVKPRQPAARGCKASSGAADQLIKNSKRRHGAPISKPETSQTGFPSRSHRGGIDPDSPSTRRRSVSGPGSSGQQLRGQVDRSTPTQGESEQIRPGQLGAGANSE